MNNYVFYAPTKIFFGKNQVSNLREAVERFGKSILMVYGGGSIKQNGIYDDVRKVLEDCNVWELSGVEPNPKIETVRKGVAICRENHIDFVLAVGGGSTIDCSKVIAAAYYYEKDAWDIVKDPSLIKEVLPVVSVLTLSATGSEMNKNAVISNMEINEKIGTSSLSMIPSLSVLDPQYTYSVSKYQTASGTADIMSHVFENYFKDTEDTFIQDRFSEGILEACIKYCPVALKEPDNYEARAQLMWASTMALNGLCGAGKGGAWSCHPIEHELSAFYDITHGVGLAIVTIRWMRYILSEKTIDRFVLYAKRVWHIEDSGDKYAMAEEAINKTEQFFREIGLPMNLTELGIDDSRFQEMAERAVEHGALSQAYVPLEAQDVFKILKACQ